MAEKNKADEAAENERLTHENAEGNEPLPQTTAAMPEPPATGPAFSVSTAGEGEEDSVLANMRLESIRVDGEPCAPKDLASKLKKADDGTVVITAVAHPTAGGEEAIRSAIGNRQSQEMTLQFEDHKATGDFRINRMDHCGEPFGQRGYIVTMESAAKPKSED